MDPLRRQALHNLCIFVMQSRLWLFVPNIVVCCYHISKSFGNLKSVRDFRASAYFAIRNLAKMCEDSVLPPSSFKVGFAEECAEGGGAGGGIATSAGETSVELEDLLVNPSVNG